MAKPCPSGKDFPLGLKLINDRSHLHFGSRLAVEQVDFGNHLAAVHVAVEHCAVQVDVGNYLAVVHIAVAVHVVAEKPV